MDIFKDRCKQNWDYLKELQSQNYYKSLSSHEKVNYNRNFLKDVRQGSFLIKISRKNKWNYCGQNSLYIDFTYSADGWFALSSRKNAQWFTAKEAYEFVSKRKGFSVVKK